MYKWFDVFIVGNHKGREYTESDLGTIVANFEKDKAQSSSGLVVPFVKGHPKNDSPAYGWAKSVRKFNDKLQVIPDTLDFEFAKEIAAKKYPHRSVKLEEKEDGLHLVHVGFLGGVQPAIDMEEIDFEADSKQQIIIFSDDDTTLELLPSNLTTTVNKQNIMTEQELQELQKQKTLAEEEVAKLKSLLNEKEVAFKEFSNVKETLQEQQELIKEQQNTIKNLQLINSKEKWKQCFVKFDIEEAIDDNSLKLLFSLSDEQGDFIVSLLQKVQDATNINKNDEKEDKDSLTERLFHGGGNDDKDDKNVFDYTPADGIKLSS